MGGFIGGVLGAAGTQQTNVLRSEDADKANASMWERMGAQEQWMENMSNTSYQRAVADMEKAGLNPMLAYSQGGASSPGAPSMPAPAVPQRENPMGTGLSSAIAASSAMAAIDKMKADAESSRAQADNTRTDTVLKEAEAPNVGARGDLIREQMEHTGQDKELVKYHMAEIQRKLDSGYYENLAKSMGAEAALAKVKGDLGSLEIPRARNEAAAEGSWWKKSVSPYLNDFGKVMSGAGTGAGIYKYLSH